MNVAAHFYMSSWAGTTRVDVEIVGETPKRYKCKLIKDSRLPGRRRYGKAGEIMLFPKDIIHIDVEAVK